MAKYNFATGAGSMYHLKVLTRREISQLRASQFLFMPLLQMMSPELAMAVPNSDGTTSWIYVPLHRRGPS